MIKKRLFYYVITALILASCSSNPKEYDSRAIASFDKMSETIGGLTSCSYTLNTFISKKSGEQNMNENDIYMRGPDKMYVHSIGTKGERSYWYDGNRMSFFKYNKNTYDTVLVSGNIIQAIDFLHHKYGIDFPATDFFYPTFTDDMINNFDEISFYGEEKIDGVDCVVSQLLNDKTLVQIWIEKNTNLPHKLIINNTRDSLIYYEAVFSNWKENPGLPDVLFEFEPPLNSTRVELKPKN